MKGRISKIDVKNQIGQLMAANGGTAFEFGSDAVATGLEFGEAIKGLRISFDTEVDATGRTVAKNVRAFDGT